ncbi:EAL domain-containing protein [Thiotrichales bacterium 19S9-12]|nr:EAL domain-containing protein [Thiotrichales bacterium 19S9-11]MCF6811659.1 EAL domain-containing protein [Thiotrichales bacterium 19S9-12]
MNSKTSHALSLIQFSYNSEADEVLSANDIETIINHFTQKFYAVIQKTPIAHKIFNDILSPKEFRHLKNAQAKYLNIILSPKMDIATHQKKALEIGYHHCFVGVPSQMLFDSFLIYADIVDNLTGFIKEKELKKIILNRLHFDVANQIEAYALIKKAQLNVYNNLINLETNTSLSYIQNSLEILQQSFSKATTGFAIGTVKNGNYRHLLAKGNVPFAENCDVNNRENYQTVKIKAIEMTWFEEKSYIRNSLYDNLAIPDSLKNECKKYKIRSFGFFLIRDFQFAQIAYLLVCSKYPGYFIDNDTNQYWYQLADLIGNRFDFLERTHAKRQARLSDGVYYRQLLARNKIEMHYQPIIDPASGKTVKVEALARLKDDDKIITPDKFLPALGINQLRDLFEIGLNSARNDLMKISGSPVCSINLPPEALLDKEWLRNIFTCLESCNATPKTVVIEILESALHERSEIMSQLFSLREAGYSIFLDDVGSGESSLLRLIKLPVSGIKIDKSFVYPLKSKFNTLDLIFSLRFLALQRGLECVIEGVETANIVDIFSSLSGKRPLLQGYAFSKPLRIDALENWLQLDIECKPISCSPATLYGWYSRHIERLFILSNSFYAIPDLIDINLLQDAQKCPMHQLIPHIGGDEDIKQMHIEWHNNYSKLLAMIKSGAPIQNLWQEIEESKQKLQEIILNKLH